MRKQTDELEKEDGQKNKKNHRTRNMLIILFIVILGAAGVGISYFFLDQRKPEQSDVGGNAGVTRTFAPLEFVVNLADTQQRRYLKATIELGYNSKRLTRELETRVPELRDLIIDILRSKTVAEIDTTTGTEDIRRHIKAEVNRRLEADEIIEVFFTEFLIQ